MFEGWLPETPKLIVFAATIALLLYFKKLPEPFVILGAAVAGLVLYPLVHP